MQYGSFLLNKVLNVQECDATGLHSSTSAGNQNTLRLNFYSLQYKQGKHKCSL